VILGKLAVIGVPPEVWAYEVGSYRVLSSWLRARVGGLTEFATLRELRSIVEAVRLSIGLHEQIQAT
jgi:hypothetical protein